MLATGGVPTHHTAQARGTPPQHPSPRGGRTWWDTYGHGRDGRRRGAMAHHTSACTVLDQATDAMGWEGLVWYMAHVVRRAAGMEHG